MANKRKKKKKKSRFSLKRMLLSLFLIIIAAGLIFSAMLVLGVYSGAFGKLPGAEDIKGIRQDNASLVLASDGKVMGKYFIVNRQSITNEDISPYVRQALVATEDKRFFEHHGIDAISLARVFFKSLLLADPDQGGGSTISQQLAKNLFPRKEYHYLSLPINKIREMFIASLLEDVYSKEEILTLYLNTVTFGENVYGIEAAALRFYNKPSSKLNLSESATLIGMLAANTYYNPRLHPENALRRRNTVLERMHSQGIISMEQMEATREKPIALDYMLMDAKRGLAPYFMEYIRDELIDILGDEKLLETGGFKIYTTIDSRLQSFAESSAENHLYKLQDEFDRHWKGRNAWEGQPGIFEHALISSEAYKKLESRGMSRADIMKELSVPHKRNIYTHEGEKILNISTIDSLSHYIQLLNTGFLAMDPGDGAILAWVGGVDFQYLPFDHVLSKRQAGSTFKPFVYAAAITDGMEPCHFIANEKRTYEAYGDWSPGNSDGKYGGYCSLRGGLMKSLNTITAEVIVETGPERVAELAYKCGIRSDLPEVPSLALGTADVSLLEMVTAYACFANNGLTIEPYSIVKIEDSEGKIIYSHEDLTGHDRAFTEETAIIMNSMLRSVVDSGTARSARTVYGLTSELAGKTGTTQNNADGWFIGFTPGIVAGCWVGAESPGIHFRSTALGSGSHMALPVVAETLRKTENNSGMRARFMKAFQPVPDSLIAMFDCPSYTTDIPSQYLSRKEERELKKEYREIEQQKVKEEKPGFFKRIGNFFRKKKK